MFDEDQPTMDSGSFAMDWDNYRTLGAVVREGGLIAGAKSLGISEQAARRRLDALERACGFALFRRSVKGLFPTPMGRALADIVRTMGQEAAAVGVLPRLSRHAPHTVRVMASQILGAEVLASLFRRLRRETPDLAIELTLAANSADLPDVAADVAVTMAPPRGEGAVTRNAGVVRLGLYAHRDYLERAGVPSSSVDLRRFSLIGPDSPDLAAGVVAALGLGLERSDFGLRSDSWKTQASAIRSGAGIGVGYVALMDRDPELIRVLPHIGADLDLWVVSPGSVVSRGAVRLVFDAVADHLAGITAGADSRGL